MDPIRFSTGRLPRIIFGDEMISSVPELITARGRHCLLITGRRSFRDSPAWHKLTTSLQKLGVSFHTASIDGEPSPELVDAIVAQFGETPIDVVLAIGGGSVLDGGKAVAGLLRIRQPVTDFLEGVGPELPWPGPAVPFIAVPTTAGTGSEATRNAVLSRTGPDGYKKSFRHEDLVPVCAVIDPQLLAGCPPTLIAANGMDAMTQLLESYVSTRANPFSDMLALDGLRRTRDSLLNWYHGRGDIAAARRGMAWAALLSGITLAHVGLGAVHGLASPLGAFFPIPHGVVCGTLVASVTAHNIRALRERESRDKALQRYAELGRLLNDRDIDADDAAADALVDLLQEWTEALTLPRLGDYGVTTDDLPRIVAACRGSSMQTNPLVLTDAEITDILRERL